MEGSCADGSEGSGDSAGSVVFVTQQFPPDKSGHASRISETATALSDGGWDVSVLAPPPSFPPEKFDRTWRLGEQSVVDGVTVHRRWTWQPANPDPGFSSRMAYYVLFALHATVWLLFNGRRYDVVVTTTPPISTGIAGFPATLLGCTWVVDVRDLWIEASVSLGFIAEGGLLERASRRFQRRVLRTADTITVTTGTLGETLCEQYGSALSGKMLHLPNGVDVTGFRSRTDGGGTVGNVSESEPGDDRGHISGSEPGKDANPDSSNEPFVVIYTGNIGHAQDLASCIRALGHLPEDVVIRLVGGGDSVPELDDLATDLGVRDRVEFVGTVPHDRVPELLDDADVGIAPLRDDADLSYAMPTKVYEYLGCELPAVVTGEGEIRRFIRESEGGIHADNDSESIVAAIERLRTDPELRRRMGRQGFEYVRREYDRERIARRFDEHLRNLVAGTPGATT